MYHQEQLSSLSKAAQHLEVISFLNSAYAAACGLNLGICLLCLLKLADFQDRVGTLKRALARAAADVRHFLLALALVVLVYGAVGTAVFGPTVRVRIGSCCC